MRKPNRVSDGGRAGRGGSDCAGCTGAGVATDRNLGLPWVAAAADPWADPMLVDESLSA